MKLLLPLPVTSDWYLAIDRLLKKHYTFAWKMTDVLATLITAANEVNVRERYKHSGVHELFNDFAKHIGLKYDRMLNDYTEAAGTSLAYDCIYPWECRAMREALSAGVRYFETNHAMARELVEAGRVEYFVCVAVSQGVGLFTGHRFTYTPNPCVKSDSQTTQSGYMPALILLRSCIT